MLFFRYFRINIKSALSVPNFTAIYAFIKNKIQEYGVTALGYNGIYSLITTINEQIISTEKEIQS